MPLSTAPLKSLLMEKKPLPFFYWTAVLIKQEKIEEVIVIPLKKTRPVRMTKFHLFLYINVK